MTINKTSPVKRKRRTDEEMESHLEAIKRVLNEYEGPITIRHLFYRLVGLYEIEKEEKAYKRLCSDLARWRKAGRIPFSAFIDGTRWYHGSTIFDGVQDALLSAAQNYRRDLWENSEYYVEVWTEKDAIAGLVVNACSAWNLRVFPCKGFASLSALANAAGTFLYFKEHQRRNPVILYLGDHDPSGRLIDDSIRKSFSEDFDLEITFKRIAIQHWQIEELDLPTRPLKKGKNTHAKGWEGECVEIDTLTPNEIHRLLEDEIEKLIDPDELARMRMIEETERESISELRRYLN